MPRGNPKNLVPNEARTPNERQENARKAGKASGEARRRKRDMREAANQLLNMQVSPVQTKVRAAMGALGIEKDDQNYNMAVLAVMALQAMSGNVNAAKFIRDTAGQNPLIQLQERQFEYEKERRSGQGAEIEDISAVVMEIWGYNTWQNMLKDGIPVVLVQSIFYHFGADHIQYIQQCHNSMYNVLEGAVRSGKTVDNVLAFAMELCNTPDKFHLATGSTMANAKLNIGDANGFGLEHIFRGQCRWSEYKDNAALIIRGPYTNFEEKVVIFGGAALASSFKKIRGNSYGMWIATEINLHHQNSIVEAFNRTLAAKKRKIFWDLNPCHPKDPIYVDYIDKYAEKAAAGQLTGGYNYRHFTIFDNINITKERLQEIVDQYDQDSIWYTRDILGKRSIAEGLIYQKLATVIAQKSDTYLMPKKEAQKLAKTGKFIRINIGVDFGGNGSGHSFVATAVTEGYELLVVLKSERWLEGTRDKKTGARIDDIDPEKLAALFVRFYKAVRKEYGFVTKVYADSAEQVLIRGLRNALLKASGGETKIINAAKSAINDRIFATTALTAQGRLRYTEDTTSWQEAVSMAVWDSKKLELERLDDGTSDIDSMDAFEYSFERDIGKLLKGSKLENKSSGGDEE